MTWIKQPDYNILTSGKKTFIRDKRFQALDGGMVGDWTLQVKSVEYSDRGMYECQVGVSRDTYAHVQIFTCPPALLFRADVLCHPKHPAFICRDICTTPHISPSSSMSDLISVMWFVLFFSYEKVSTVTSVVSAFVNLTIMKPMATIDGSRDRHVDLGSTITLECAISKVSSFYQRLASPKLSQKKN